MIKKNLIILLLIPFIIAIIGSATINSTYSIIENDILSIIWDYNDTEAFKLQDELHELNATYQKEKDYALAPGNDLVWTLKNKDIDDSKKHAEIVKNDDKYYLKTISEGEVVITCANEKGNVFRNMNAIIYETGAIIIQSEISGSQTNIDNKIYYGQYDFDVDGKTKKEAKVNLNVRIVPDDLSDTLCLDSKSDNVEFDVKSGLLEIKDVGDAYIKIGCEATDKIKVQSFDFTVVKDGINVYTYNELLNCTNKSTNGEIVVLRKSFESLDNYKASTSNNVELFGNSNNNLNFTNDVYSFKTTYNHEFIDQWNANVKKNGGKNFLRDYLNVGLRVQKDFYGNGYTINMHNLTYPKKIQSITNDDGTKIEKPFAMSTDLFCGPLPFYCLGDHNDTPLIEAYGQDNIGMYVDGNNITVNDVNMKNCDFGNSLSNLDYVGTVIEIYGNDDTIINSRVSNGKNVIRAFSSNNTVIENSLLSNARNFLLYTGSNEYIKLNDSDTITITDLDGNSVTDTAKNLYYNGLDTSNINISTFANLYDLVKDSGIIDQILTRYCIGEAVDYQTMNTSLTSIQQNKYYRKQFVDSGNVLYKGSVTTNNVMFYRSGVSSIGIDSMFNGAFLYSQVPSIIKALLAGIPTKEGIPMASLLPTNVGGNSYPIKVTIGEGTKFYDYKNINEIDVSGLINQNVIDFAEAAAAALGMTGMKFDGMEITIDDFFPIKNYLVQAASADSIYEYNGEKYINCPIAVYGGGLNVSSINTQAVGDNLSKAYEINLKNEYIKITDSGLSASMVKHLMQKAVTVTIGFEPFKFTCVKNNGYLFGETPNIQELRK